jgi:hypothetical protein
MKILKFAGGSSHGLSHKLSRRALPMSSTRDFVALIIFFIIENVEYTSKI